MLVYNQTRSELNWDARGQRFKWEPFGACEVPDDLVEHLRLQRVAIGEYPVAPEEKARAIAEQESAAVRQDDILRLQERAESAEAEARAAKAEIVAAEERRTRAEAATAGLRDRIATLESELGIAKADGKAAEDLLAETSRKLAVLERKQQSSGAKKGEGPKSAAG